MALTVQTVFAQCMRELIRNRIDTLKDNLAYGAAVTTLEGYREVVGQIRGLEEAIELMDAADEKLRERERGS